MPISSEKDGPYGLSNDGTQAGWLPDLLAAFRNLYYVPNNKKRCQVNTREQTNVIISMDLGKVEG